MRRLNGSFYNNLHVMCYIVDRVIKKFSMWWGSVQFRLIESFDGVDHQYLVAALTAAGFGLVLRGWIVVMYNDIGFVVRLNGHLLKSFDIVR